MSKFKDRNWLAIITGILAALGIAFGIVTTIKLQKEEARRIEAQNEVARQSEVIQESETRWSRLSLQVDNINEVLRSMDSDFANKLEENNERILALSETVAQIKPTRIIVQQQNVTETLVEDDRIRVDFDETADPVRVAGFTLTNPTEAELEVSFTRPVRLRTTITQRDDGTWTTYFESDWENLEIQEMETVINPLPRRVTRSIRENFIVGLNTGISAKAAAFHANVYALYEFGDGRFALGPTFGITTADEHTRLSYGLGFQWRPGLRNR